MSADSIAKASTKVYETITQYRAWREGLSAGKAGSPTVGFVPTMGALHEGHMSLIARARQQCDKVAVSIFVNPLQFAPHEDFDRYPRPFEKDLAMCESMGVDAVFHPSVQELYGSGSVREGTTVVPAAALTATMEGAFRPGFFTGVATVVCKLFSIIRPTSAFFGEKDYQQLQVIKRMVADLNLPLTIEPVATMREHDGLAMSSRNVYLSPDQRAIAPALQRTLSTVRDEILAGVKPDAALENGRRTLNSQPGLIVQYLEAVNGETLEPIAGSQKSFVVLVAAKLGEVRLIDNLIVAD